MPVVGTPITGAEAEAGWIDIIEAGAYFATRLNNAAWTASGSKEAALLTAQSDIEHCTDFTFTDADKETPSDAMKSAVCEQALFLLIDPDMETRRNLRAQGVSAAGLVQEQYRPNAVQVVIAPKARNLLAAYASPSNQITSYTMHRKETEV